MIATTLKAQSDWIAQRKRELGVTGYDFVAINSGSRRTEEKRTLLKRLADVRRMSKTGLRFWAMF